MGTPQYMAPEQLEGHDVGQPADMWALGATLYTAVEGEPPFTGPTLTATVAAILNRDPEPPAHAGHLAPVISGLLAKDPAARPDAAAASSALAAMPGARRTPAPSPEAPSDADAHDADAPDAVSPEGDTHPPTVTTATPAAASRPPTAAARRGVPRGTTPGRPAGRDRRRNRMFLAGGAVLVVVAATIALVLTQGNGGSGHPSTAGGSSSPASSGASDAVKVTGGFGALPGVSIPKASPGTALVTKTLIQGTGKPLTTSDSLVGNFALYDWKGTTSKLVSSTYTSGSPTLLSGQMLPGLEKALRGQKEGSRVLAVVPPADGFGPAGNPQIGVGGTDTLVFVIDMVAVLGNTEGATGAQVSSGGGALPTVTAAPGKAPTVKVPATAPPGKLTVKTLAQGTGAKVAKGDYVVVQYAGVVWKTGKVFDSSWSRSVPFAFTIGRGQVVKGWDNGLVGQSAGSRVLLSVPPADGYGATPPSGSGIGKTDTMIFVVDILGAYKPHVTK
jgi:peptidylprolyl isomerase